MIASTGFRSERRQGDPVTTCSSPTWTTSLMPGRGVNMGDGWKPNATEHPTTAIGSSSDWHIPERLMKFWWTPATSNYPDGCSLEGCYLPEGRTDLADDKIQWTGLPDKKLQADHEHTYKSEIKQHQRISHVRLYIYPDGGVKPSATLRNY